MEVEQFFLSIGLDCWIEPLIGVGVTNLKFLYLNFEDILEEERLHSVGSNRLHVKIILKRLRARFEVDPSLPPPPPCGTSNRSVAVTPPCITTVVKQEPCSPSGDTSQFSGVEPSSYLDLSALNDSSEPACNGNAPAGQVVLSDKIIQAARPEDPVNSRFLDDWDVYGQVRFFDTATYEPELPRSISHYAEDCRNVHSKDFEAARELLCQNLFQDLCGYFIWRVPSRFLYTVMDRLVQRYPWWDDGSPTKTESIKKRILEKYALLRRYKQPPDWVKQKYNYPGTTTTPNKRTKRASE